MTKKSKEARIIVARLDRIIEEYKAETPTRKRDYKTYEQQYAARARKCFQELEPLVEKAVSSIKLISGEKRGKEQKLSLKQEILLLLLKHFCAKSNRSMEWMSVLFVWLTNVDVSYKTIERLYSREEVRLALFNLHVLLLRKKGIDHVDCAGDGTGYALCVKVHYATEAQKLKDKAKASGKHVSFIYSFALIDIESRMYVAYGTSFRCEKDAFDAALQQAKEIGININSIRLDKYYSGEAYVNLCQEYLGNVKTYIIPKKNIAHLGIGQWCQMIYQFIDDTKGFLKEYFQRNQSESGFAEDKKRTGWKISQKIEKRVDTAYSLTVLWHNLFWEGAEV